MNYQGGYRMVKRLLFVLDETDYNKLKEIKGTSGLSWEKWLLSLVQ